MERRIRLPSVPMAVLHQRYRYDLLGQELYRYDQHGALVRSVTPTLTYKGQYIPVQYVVWALVNGRWPRGKVASRVPTNKHRFVNLYCRTEGERK